MTRKDPAYGGVVIDDRGRVLLREPANHYGRATWTFPKGRPDEGEDPKDTALRETLEETGVSAEVVGDVPIPGSFPGTVTDNVYFLMRPTGQHHQPDNEETWGIRWATPDEARELIRESESRTVRDRDLAVLDAALSLARERGLLKT